MNSIEIRHDIGYGFIPRRIMRDPDLSVTAKSVYCYLASFAGNTGKSFPSTGLIAKELNLSKNTLFKYLKELKDKGVITVEREQGEGNKFGRNIYYLHNEINKKEDEKPYTKSSDMEKPYTGNPYTRDCDTNSNNVNNNNSNSNNNKDSQAAARPSIQYKEIIEYLNDKSGKNFSFKAKGNRRCIEARVNEGYTLDDFKRVIDVKAAEWKGTKMDMYLRPSTLFSNKFDNYLNQEVKENGKSKVSDGVDEIFGFGFEV